MSENILLVLAKQDQESGALSYKRAEDAAFPKIEGAMPLYEKIKAQWAEFTKAGDHTSVEELFGIAIKITNESVKYDGNVPSGLRSFLSGIKTLAGHYYFHVHIPSVEVAKLEGKRIDIRE